MKTFHIFAAVSLLVMAQVACNFPTQSPSAPVILTLPAATAAMPTETPVPPPTPPPLYQTVTLTGKTLEESGKGPDYTLKAVTPILDGSSDPRVGNFNSVVADRVQQAVDQFKQDLSMASVTPIAAGSFFSLTYVQISPPGNLLSLQIHIEGYSDGAAHPYHLTSSFNYDLEKGQEISLDQLFLPGTNYLPAISDYCAAELSKRDIGFDMFSEGANPIPENYAAWNVSAEGLLITFNEYQVAPYAAGPQEVFIPFAALKDSFDPQGPLSALLADK